MKEHRLDLSPKAVLQRLLRWGLVALTGLALLVLAFYLVENARGRIAWSRYKHQLQGKGEKLDWADYVGKAAPEDQNFANTPLLKAALQKDYSSTPPWRGFSKLALLFGSHCGDWTKGQPVDLQACQQKLLEVLPDGEPWSGASTGPTNVLAAFEPIEPSLHELVTAASQPYAQFPVPLQKPWNGGLPQFAAIRQLVQLLAVHAGAQLVAQHTDGAFEDTRALLRITETVHNQPTLVSAMVRVAILGGPATQPIWEGLVAGRWSDEQLLQFQKWCLGFDLMSDLGRAIRGGERASINELMSKGEGEARKLLVDSSSESSDGRWKSFTRQAAVRLAPSGWNYQNQLFYNRMIQDFVLAHLDAGPAGISPQAIHQAFERFQQEMNNAPVFGRLAGIAMPNFQKAIQATTRAQTHLNLLGIGCALERFRHATGSYPEALDEVVPKYLDKIPRDLIAGQSLQYQRIGKTHYQVYSFGWDGKDDGGTIASDRFHGDWVLLTSMQSADQQ